MPNGTQSFEEWKNLEPDVREYAIYEILNETRKALAAHYESCPHETTIAWNKWISRLLVSSFIVSLGIWIIKGIVK